MPIPVKTFKFLKDLSKNNDRDWFNKNKDTYLAAHESMIEFADELLAEMNKVDQIETASGKKSLMRIYRDVRFSKDKSPYKSNISGHFRRATKQLRGGYYFHIEPGNTVIAGGFWGPEAEDLKRIRQDIALDDKPLRKIINNATFKKYFGEIQGDELKTAPKGFDKEHPAIDLIRKKRFVVVRKFTDKEAQSKDFLKEAVKTFKAMRPFFDQMSLALTTDENGVPMYDD